MNLLQRYVLGRVLVLTAGTLGGVLLLVWVVQVLQRVNLVTDGGTAMGSFLWIALLILPRIFTIILPFALVLAIVNALNGMNNDSETVVINASGAGKRLFVVPIFLIAVFATVLHLAAVHLLEPSSRQAFREAIAESRAALLSTVLREGQFRDLGSDITVHINGRAPGGEIEGMFLSDRQDPQERRAYYARTAIIAEREGVEYVLMRDGQLHSRDVASGEVRIIEFSTYALDLSNLAANDGNEPTLAAKDRSTIDLLDPDPEDREWRESPGSFRAELHKRFSSWLYIWGFVIVALHIAARPRSTRETSGSVLAFVLTTCIVARGVGFALEDAAITSTAARYGLYATPLALVVIFGGAMLLGRRFVLPDVARKARNRVWDGLGARLQSLRPRFSDGANRADGL